MAINFLEAWDIGTVVGLEPMHQPWLTRGMRFAAALGSHQVLGVVSVLSMVFFLFIGYWRTGLCLVAAGLLGYGIEQGAKPWVNRSRPDVKWVEPQDKETTPSFPSGHALLAMAVYGTLALSLAGAMENRKAKVVVVAGGFFLPLVIGFSRMYLGVNYLSDVVGGLCAGLGCVFLFRWIGLKWNARAVPQFTQAATTAASLPPSRKAMEKIHHSGGEQVQP